MSVLRGTLQRDPQGLDVEQRRPLDLGPSHRFEDPVAQGQPDPDGPAQLGRGQAIAIRGVRDRVDVDGHAVRVSAAEGQATTWLESGDLRLEPARTSRSILL